jgi:hypothetical protein
MNKKSILLIIQFVVMTSCTFAQSKIEVTCKTPDCSITDGRNSLPDDYLKKCKSNELVPFVIAQKDGHKSRSAILHNTRDTFYIDPLLRIPFRDSTLKSIRLLNVSSNNKLGDILGKWYASPSLQERNIDKGDIETDYRYFVEPEQFEELIDDALDNFGYAENDRSILRTGYSIMYLNADIKKITFNKTTQNKAEYGRVQLEIDWSFESPYTDDEIHFSTNTISDPLNIDRSRASYNYVLRDAIEYGLIELLSKEAVTSILELDIENAQGKNNTKTTITEVKRADRALSDKLKTVARISTTSDAVSSGTIISSDGYIITDFSVISESDSLIVEIDSTEYRAEIVSKAEFFNLALLKIEAENLTPTSFSLSDNVGVTDNVYAIGYSEIKLLNAYATSGRISGIRQFENIKYYQTDLPLSNGNDGGTVVNDEFDCIGIINCKVNSLSVEGIGFVTPIRTALQALNIELITE